MLYMMYKNLYIFLEPKADIVYTNIWKNFIKLFNCCTFFSLIYPRKQAPNMLSNLLLT
jgi:hypothetical protein